MSIDASAQVAVLVGSSAGGKDASAALERLFCVQVTLGQAAAGTSR
jgi:hypothetical protein